MLGEPILDARYQLERRLGQGGMGVVFQARHIFLKTAHAIKVILPDLVGNDPMLVTRFRQEALAAAAIRHQNIIAVTDFGVVRGTMPFLVMEFVNGRSLQDLLTEEGAIAPSRAIEFISAIAAGVAAAHRQKIVHRDLKPLNIMVQNDVPISEGLKILDFGLAKIKSGELLGSFVQAKTSGLMGSPFYMAPEQWSDEEPDARADIYSLGIILYQMLSAEVPFKGSSIPSIMKKHLTLPVPSFQSMGVKVPAHIEAAVRHALEKEKEARTSSVEAFLAELKQGGAPISTLGVARETGSFDLNKTVTSSGFYETGSAAAPRDTEFGAKFESLAGTVSETVLNEQLERLATSVPPQATMLDPDATQVREGGISGAAAGASSFSGVPQAGSPRKVMVFDVPAPAPSRKGSWLVIGSALVLLTLVGAGIGGYLLLRPKPESTEGQATDNRAVNTPMIKKADLVEIAGGTFEMGRSAGPSQETPPHQVKVETFFMDKSEVTNAEYSEFVRETNYSAPDHWAGPKPPAGLEQWPVVNVSFADANAFARWRSQRDGFTYRLPTEQEWEYAARNGERNDLYPWGMEWKEQHAILKDSTPSPVGSRPEGNNIWGVQDLIGNVWEWTSSKVSAYPGNPVIIPTSTQDWITIRGGGYVTDPTNKDNPVSSCMRQFITPRARNALLGFRLVRNAS